MAGEINVTTGQSETVLQTVCLNQFRMLSGVQGSFVLTSINLIRRLEFGEQTLMLAASSGNNLRLNVSPPSAGQAVRAPWAMPVRVGSSISRPRNPRV